MMRFLSRVILAACALLLNACDQGPANEAARPEFKNTDITGLEYARDFSLPDSNGKLRSLADFKGKVVVVFFGYTQCPDVCPTTLVDLAAAMKQLGPLAERVQVLFISVDPERDHPEFLARYVPEFDPRFLGLVGDRPATDKVIKEFRVYYQKVPGKEPGSYSVDHTASSFVFDPQGRIRLLIMPGQGAGPIAHDLKILLS